MAPEHIIKSAIDGKTSLGKQKAFPQISGDDFLVGLLNDRYNTLQDSIGDLSETELKDRLNKYITKTQKIERNSIQALESLGSRIINDLFKIPQDTINIKMKLVDDIDTSNIRMTPESEPDFTFSDINSMHRITDEIYKRRLINSIIAGVSAYYGNNVKMYLSELYSINPELPLLYDKINTCNDYLMFIAKERLNPEDLDYTTAGRVDVIISGAGEMPTVESYGITFPVLLEETIKGILEIASTYGLPDDMDEAKFVIGKSDFELAKGWDWRIGYPLWEIFESCIDELGDEYDIKEIGLNFIIKELSQLDVNEFNESMQEIFAKTKRGSDVIKEVLDKIIREKGRDDFNNFMSQKSSEFYQLNDSTNNDEDEYFTPDELYESLEERIEAAESNVNTEPTDGQKNAGNYKKGTLHYKNLTIKIENPKGSYRRGKDSNGKEYKNKMKNTYGYIKGYKSTDGDQIDVYLSNHLSDSSGDVFIIDQINPKTKEFDEHKCMLGFDSFDEAKKAYLSNYDKNWGGLGRITKVTWEQFIKWLKTSKKKNKPFYEYAKVKNLNSTKGTKKINEERGRISSSVNEFVSNTLVPHIIKMIESKKLSGFSARILGREINFVWHKVDAIAGQLKVDGKNVIILSQDEIAKLGKQEIVSALLHELTHVLQSTNNANSREDMSDDVTDDGTKRSQIAKDIIYFTGKNEFFARLSAAFYDVKAYHLEDALESGNPVEYLTNAISNEMNYELVQAYKSAIMSDKYYDFKRKKNSVVYSIASVKNELYYNPKIKTISISEEYFNVIKDIMAKRITSLEDKMNQRIYKMVHDLLSDVSDLVKEGNEYLTRCPRRKSPMEMNDEHVDVKNLNSTKGKKKINEERGRINSSVNKFVGSTLVPRIIKMIKDKKLKSFSVNILNRKIKFKWDEKSDGVASQLKVDGEDIILLNPHKIIKFGHQEIVSALLHELTHVLQSTNDVTTLKNLSANVVDDGTKASQTAKDIIYFTSKDELFARLSAAFYDAKKYHVEDALESDNPVEYLTNAIRNEMNYELIQASKNAIIVDSYYNFMLKKNSVVYNIASVKNELYYNPKIKKYSFDYGAFNTIKDIMVHKLNRLEDKMDERINKMVYDLLSDKSELTN